MLHFVPAKVNRRDTSKDRYGDAHSPLFGDELFHNAGKVLEWSFEDADTISALEMFGPAHVLFSNRLTKAISRDAEMPEKFCGPRLSGLPRCRAEDAPFQYSYCSTAALRRMRGL